MFYRTSVLVVVAVGVLAFQVLPSPAYAAAGDLDSGFGAGGKVVTDFGGSDRAMAVIQKPDGKILAAGLAGGNGGDFALAQYHADGTLDSGFGAGGKVTTTISSSAEDGLRGLALQPDGKIVAGGSSKTNDLVDATFALARYHADGSLDTSFAGGGWVTTDFGPGNGSAIRGVALQPDGKIIAGGIAGIDFALARYNPDGSLDTTFGNGGKVMTDLGDVDHGFAMTQAIDGDIILAGASGLDFGVARYNSDGSLDTSFGNGGKVVTDLSGIADAAYGVTLQPDGKVVAAGVANAATAIGGGNEKFALVRYNTDGSLDTSFGTGGKVTTDLTDKTDGVRGVAVQWNGKILVAGKAGDLTSSGAGGVRAGDFGLARYHADGSLDTSFGSGGVLTTDFNNSPDGAMAVTLQFDGKLLAVGNVTGGNFGLARYQTS